MGKRQRVSGNAAFSKFFLFSPACLILGVLALLPAAFGQHVDAPTVSVTGGRQTIAADSAPYIVEQRRVVGNATFDSRFRLETALGPPSAGCATWRIETWVRSDGRLIFQLNDPADQKVLLDSQFDDRHLQFVIGSPECNFKVTIERNK